VKPVIEEMEAKYPELAVRMLEVYHNQTNQQIYIQVTSRYGTTDSGIPQLVIGDEVLIGDTSIIEQLEGKILAEKQRLASCTPASSDNSVGQPECPSEGTDLSVQLVIASALIDSINPCAFSVLVFLLISIVAIADRRRILMVGAAYITAVFVLYLVSGIGLLSAIHITGFSFWLAMAGGVIAVVFGLVNIFDVLRKTDEFLLGIPESRKELIDTYIRKASLPAAFGLGILVGIFELPCTGGIYLAILGLLSRSHTFVEGLPYLLLYNLVFILPLALILLLVAYGISPDRINSWRLSHRRMLRLFVGCVMIALGAYILYSVVG
jgi:cytochrome c biogenesis protein CcdA